LEHDLQDLHTHQDFEVKERSLTLEQTRSKYQRELEDLTKELERERNSAVDIHAENRYISSLVVSDLEAATRGIGNTSRETT